jgi:hypothetical protein
LPDTGMVSVLDWAKEAVENAMQRAIIENILNVFIVLILMNGIKK